MDIRVRDESRCLAMVRVGNFYMQGKEFSIYGRIPIGVGAECNMWIDSWVVLEVWIGHGN